MFSGCDKNAKIWPLSCSDLSVPKSLLKVKVWYDFGFMKSKLFNNNHTKAIEYIYATLAHVQHFMCSSTIGTTVQTEVKNLLLKSQYSFQKSKFLFS